MTGSSTRRLVVALVLATIVGLAGTSARATARGETNLVALDHQVLVAINAFRFAHHLVPLRDSPALDASARQHSLEMAADGYFAHPSANGTAFWKRIRQYFWSSGYSYWSAGENLLWSSPGIDAATALNMWAASPEHLRNLLAPGWRRIGISAVHVVGASGIYRGMPVTIITTDFGVRH